MIRMLSIELRPELASWQRKKVQCDRKVAKRYARGGPKAIHGVFRRKTKLFE